MEKFTIDSLLRLDDSNIPKPVDIRQMMNKNIRELYTRDKSPDKEQYINECIIIYHMGDPKSPCRQQGLSDDDCLKYAIKQTSLPKSYKPDLLVLSLINQYKAENLTEAGRVFENLLKAIHTQNRLVERYITILEAELTNTTNTLEQVVQISNILSSITKISKEVPELVSSLNTAKQNILYEVQEEQGRGGTKILHSMDANNYTNY